MEGLNWLDDVGSALSALGDTNGSPSVATRADGETPTSPNSGDTKNKAPIIPIEHYSI